MKSYFRTTTFRRMLPLTALALWLATAANAHAGLIAYQSRAAFDTAIAGWTSTTADFEGESAGTAYGPGSGPAGSGFSLTYVDAASTGLTPTLSDQFWTTSGLNYLGLDNFDGAFEAGDALTFNLTSPMQAFGLYVLGTSDIGAGDITLTSGAASVANAGTAELQDGFGSFAFFLGFVSDDGGTFSSVTLHDLLPGDARLLPIDVDDVVLAQNNGVTPPASVPEPGSLLLALAGMLALGAAGRRAAR